MNEERWVNAADLADTIRSEIESRMAPLERRLEAICARLERLERGIEEARGKLSLPLMI